MAVDKPIQPVRGRFAPSPTGRMHLGNVYSALLSWLSARSRGGEWVVRIEDIDTGRSRREYAQQILDDLQWLGLEWDGEVTYQSERGAIYAEHLERLNDLGLIYPCRCTRADIMATQAPHESDGRVVYGGRCRPGSLHPMSAAALECCKEKLRLVVPDREIQYTDGHYGPQTVNLSEHCGDFILRRADGAWAYQLAVVVDDALTGVTEVVRGRDLILSAAQQIYLYGLLGYEAPQFCHLPLLCNTTGNRLSKRDGSLDMGALRSRYTAGEIIGWLAHEAGIAETRESVSAAELIGIFDWGKVPTEDRIISYTGGA